ncbi:MAG TPA: tRNA (cytidine(34)-2'-O)-methyltransferase [Leptospiraceae bacterium]|nr:tRNA (cytidine(34)-2'-O)-methyltransferase [Leptospiraceae bacterium]HRG74133.1 tRNA (cytidine(34)-2'-O)-methyltransferase [Leptospiraceae bacterium]
MLNIALYRPEIPPNTGNIARLCVGIQAKLHIVGKPSFDMSEKAVRRAGLDYWEHLLLFQHSDWDSFIATIPDVSRVFLVTKFGKSLYSQQTYEENDYFVFGRETSGLPEEIRNQFPDSNQIHIPMRQECRSLNLSNAVAIVSYEAVRQLYQQSV